MIGWAHQTHTSKHCFEKWNEGAKILSRFQQSMDSGEPDKRIKPEDVVRRAK